MPGPGEMEVNGRHILPQDAPIPTTGSRTVNEYMCQVLARARNKDKVGGGGKGDRECIDGEGGWGRPLCSEEITDRPRRLFQDREPRTKGP